MYRNQGHSQISFKLVVYLSQSPSLKEEPVLSLDLFLLVLKAALPFSFGLGRRCCSCSVVIKV